MLALTDPTWASLNSNYGRGDRVVALLAAATSGSPLAFVLEALDVEIECPTCRTFIPPLVETS